MTFRLVLQLPFDVTLVHNQRFEEREAALKVQGGLPGSFDIVPEEDVDLKKAIEVPIRREEAQGRGDEN